MLSEKLTNQFKKGSTQNNIILGLAAISTLLAIIFGTMLLQNRTTKAVIIPDNTDKVRLDDTNNIATLADEEALNQEENPQTLLYNSTVDSFGIIIDTLEKRIELLKEDLVLANAIDLDYVGQLIKSAKRFSDSDCNKSLAFLYAAKKIAQTDGITSNYKKDMTSMINKCEDALFGKKPSDTPTPTSSVD